MAAEAQVSIHVRHAHLRKGGLGEIRISESGISFREVGKKQKHSREFPYDEIQQLWLGPTSFRILTYEDMAWKLGRDREYEFDELPDGAAALILDAVRPHVDERRLVAAIPDPVTKPIWQANAKLLIGRGGPSGVLLVGDYSIVFSTEKEDASRTWHFGQIDNISSAGPFDLTITTFEQDRGRFAGHRDFCFQLKDALTEQRYNALWRRLNESRLPASSMNSRSKENTIE